MDRYEAMVSPGSKLKPGRLVTFSNDFSAEILETMKQPGMMDYGTKPQGTMKFAAHLYKVGTLKTLPKAWTDYYLPSSADLDGN